MVAAAAGSRARRSQSASTSVTKTQTRERHGRRAVSVFPLVSFATATGVVIGAAPPARAQVVEVKLSNISYEPCGRAGGAPGTGSFRARCFKITADAFNPSTQPLFNADVYGKVVDADNDPCLRSGRVGTIESLPVGTSRIEIKITVAASQSLPLSLSKFKAEGFTQEVNRCELSLRAEQLRKNRVTRTHVTRSSSRFCRASTSMTIQLSNL